MNLKRHFTRPNGETVEDQRERRLSFGGAVDRAVVYLMAGLIGWLCINTLAMREQIAVIVERGNHDKKWRDEMDSEVKSLRVNDSYLLQEHQALREEMVRRGWNPSPMAPKN